MARSRYFEDLKREAIRKMSDVEWLEQKLLSELDPDLEKDIWHRIDNGLELMPVITKLNTYLFKGE